MEGTMGTYGNNSGEIPVLSLDSTIESIFYQMCMSEPSWRLILLEWANSKKIYCGHTNMISSMYGNYSRHDCSHSVSILGGILAVIGEERIKKMRVMDLWLLLHCAYAHDLGMPYSYDEAVKLWESAKTNSEFKSFLDECRLSDDEDTRKAINYIDSITNIIIPEKSSIENNENIVRKFSYSWPVTVHRYYMYLTSEYCRQRHAHRTKKVLRENIAGKTATSPYNIEDRLYKLVGKCSEMHGGNFEEILTMEPKEWTPVGYCHPPFIAALLRLGDLLDIDNNRFDAIVLSYYGNLNKISEIHRKKHESIVHIDYEVNKIEITAESDDEDVCRCASDWFQYLDSEVKNIIFHWSEIAPEELGGCQFSVPNTKIYLKGQPFREVANHEFQVNKEMLINLVIGRNLYNSKLDFIREYLQNSLDAVKMKLWLELKDGQNEHYINQKYLEKWRPEEAYSITPFQINEYVYDNYRIDVACEWDDKDSDHPFVSITINDRGIGIDAECVEAISHIGSGWKRRRKYRDDLEKMPAWLRPTGGFGIGMQSGFMIAEKIKIVTKCENELNGKEIILHSSTTSGRIEERGIVKKHKGTSIEVKIPYQWFLEEKNYNYYNLGIGDEVKEYFVPTVIMGGVYTIIKNYIKTIAGNSLFPILISQKSFQPDIIGNKINRTVDENKIVQIDGIEYQIYYTNEKNTVYIWESDRAILCTIQPKCSFEKAKLNWAYKGIKVWPEMQDTENIIAKSFGNISIDIMGIKVEDCLTVDRNKFTLGFDHFSLLCQLLKAYLKGFEDISDLFNCDIKNSDLSDINREDCYKFLLCKNLLERKEHREKIKLFLEKIQENNQELMSTSSLLVDCVSMNDDKSEFVTKKQLLPYFCNLFWHDGSEKLLFCDKNYDFSRIRVSPAMDEFEKCKVILDKNVYGIMGIYANEHVMFDKNIGIQCLRNQAVIINKDEEKSLVFGQALECEKQKIFYTEKYYERLWVTSIPFTNAQEYQEQVKNGKKLIISPINPTNTSLELIKKELSGKDDAKKCFEDYVEKNNSFKYLLDWVVNHQFVPKKYTRDMIAESYHDLIDFIYDNEHLSDKFSKH